MLSSCLLVGAVLGVSDLSTGLPLTSTCMTGTFL